MRVIQCPPLRMEEPPFRTDPEDRPKLKGVQLSPIPWGKPDPTLAPIVCQNIADTMHGRFHRPDRHLLRSVVSVCAWLFVGVVLLLVLATYARPATSSATAPATAVLSIRGGPRARSSDRTARVPPRAGKPLPVAPLD